MNPRFPTYPPRVLAGKVAARARRAWRARRGPPGPLADAAFRGLFSPEADPLALVRTTPTPFHLDPTRREAYVAALDRDWPGERARILAEADALRRGELTLLNAATARRDGASFDWHRDPMTSRSWPLDHFSRIDYLALGDPSDVKRVWELSRQQWLITLGQAYWLTGDEAFAEAAVAQVDDWIAANPVELGVNWTVAMEAGLRLVSWGWALHFVRDAAALTPNRLRRWLEAVWWHARYVGENLEHTARSGNHLLADGLGLLYAGCACPYFRDAATWRERGFRLLWAELPRQVYPDGVDYEGSTSYHRLVLELLLDARILARRLGIAVPPGVDERLAGMVEFSRAVRGPDGLGPMLGDADDGYVWRFHPRQSDDHRPAVALGALALDAPGDEGTPPEALWLGGPDGLARLGATPPARPPRDAAFPHGGVFVVSDRASRAVVDCGHLGMGPGGHGGHGHLDTLSVVLWAHGAPVLVDPGTYTYTGDLEWRRAFRCTAAHNTVRVDGAEQAEMTGPWTLDDRSAPTVHRWSVEAERVLFEGGHSGFERLTGRVRHRRQVLLIRDRHWLLVDWLDGAGRHVIERAWHFAPGTLRLDGDGVAFRGESGVGARLRWPGEPRLVCRVVVGDELERQGWVSRSYGERRPAPALFQRLEVELPVRLPVVLAVAPPGLDPTAPAEVLAVEPTA